MILLRPPARGVQLADAILHIAARLLGLHREKTMEGFCVPCLGLLHILFPVQPILKHPAQIAHGKSVACPGLFQK